MTETCDYVLYDPKLFSWGHGGIVSFVRDGLNRTAATSAPYPSSCNTALTFWLGADALYEMED